MNARVPFRDKSFSTYRSLHNTAVSSRAFGALAIH